MSICIIEVYGKMCSIRVSSYRPPSVISVRRIGSTNLLQLKFIPNLKLIAFYLFKPLDGLVVYFM
jgi:hypothetical protein